MSLKKSFLKFIFFEILIFQINCAKLLKIEKSFCKDLRDCQVYFPCSFFITGFGDQTLIKQCRNDLVFDENKQECVQPNSQEDLDCLFSKYSAKFSEDLEIESVLDDNNKTAETSINRQIQNVNKSKISGKVIKTEIKPLELTVEEVENLKDLTYKRFCVVTNWSQYRLGKARFSFEFINYHLCNRIIFSSAKLNEELDYDNEIEYNIKPTQHNDFELYSKLNSFKKKNPNLKTFLRVTDENGMLFSKISKKQDLRSNFIQNTIDYLSTYEFDGVDIHWQNPGGFSGSPFDKQNFVLLLKEFKMKLKPTYELMITISPLNDRIQNSYSIFEINNLVDLVNVEAFDYYGPWDKKTGLIAPLRKMNEQYLTEAFMNIEGTVNFLKALGLSPAKIILGIAAYARNFLIEHPARSQVGAPTTGNGFSGVFTKTNGLLSHFEVCEAFKRQKWTEGWDDLAKAPFAFNSDNEWISYENEESLRQKMEFVKENSLGGVAVNTLDMDDFQGAFCNKGSYPFLKASLALLTKNSSSPTNLTTKSTSSFQTTQTTLKTISTPSKKLENTKNRAVEILKLKIKSLKEQTKSVVEEKETTSPKLVGRLMEKEGSEKLNSEVPTAIPVEIKDLPFILITPPAPIFLTQPKIKNDIVSKLSTDEIFLVDEMSKILKSDYAENPIMTSESLFETNNFLVDHKQQEEAIRKVQIEHHKQLEEMIQKLQPPQNKIRIDQSTTTQPTIISTTTTSTTTTRKVETKNVPFSPGDTICMNKKDGIHRDEMSCNRFHICETFTSVQSSIKHSRTHTFNCPQGTVFNMDECTCDWPRFSSPCVVPLKNSFCMKAGPEGKQLTSTAGPETTIILPTTSTTSTTSSTSTTTRTPSTITSTFTTMPRMLTTETTSNSTLDAFQNFIPKWSFSCFNRESGLYRDPYDCTKFYYCQLMNKQSSDNEPTVIRHDFTCPTGLHFDVFNCQCDWPNNQSCTEHALSTFCAETTD